MTYFYYKTNSWSSQPQPNEKQINLWNHVAKKSNWRIVQLPNGYYQTEYLDPESKEKEKWIDVTRRETLEGAEGSIDSSIDHYQKKLEYTKGPKVVKTFK
jgi:hypothetical protein